MTTTPGAHRKNHYRKIAVGSAGVLSALLTGAALVLLLWDLGFGSVTNIWTGGYSREGWQVVVLLAIAGSGLGWLYHLHTMGRTR